MCMYVLLLLYTILPPFYTLGSRAREKRIKEALRIQAARQTVALDNVTVDFNRWMNDQARHNDDIAKDLTTS
ncbi:Hypothetical protein FKW44_006878 [Caligus rogercresseyi]|uniref:Uncharacterized protein n=1 Tax=Caligus rogercresseyi TaxID=217165 RepID=A0A7T8KE31_CALRO|nr:Hypothetical protein FKW44_006878 [Caligus rogercresseyi]